MPTLGMFGRVVRAPAALVREPHSVPAIAPAVVPTRGMFGRALEMQRRKAQAQGYVPKIPKPEMGAGSAVKPTDDGGFWRMFGYRPDETGQEFGEWLFSGKDDVQTAKAERSAAIAAEQQRREQATQIATLRNAGVPDDQIVAFLSNPEKWSEKYATNMEAANVSGGDSRWVNGKFVTAPKIGIDEGYGYTQTPESITWGNRRGISYGEQNSVDQNAETRRNNDMTNARGWADIGVDRERLALERLKAEREGGPDFGEENQLRNQYLGQAKTFQDVRSAHSRIKAVGQATNPAEQMALIFGYMKMLDPGSTVREGEYATAQNTTGIPGWVMNAYNKAKDGVFLDRVQVQNFLEQADQQMVSAERSYTETLDQYRDMARRYGMDPSIIQDMRSPGSGPTPGQRREHAMGAIPLNGTGQFNPAAFRQAGMDLQIQRIPRDAINDLMADPSPEAIAEFNEAFKQPGMAERILNGARQ